MEANIRYVQFSGLDPVPIRLALAEPISDEVLCRAAGVPPSPFIDTLKPYRVQQHSDESYELILGPEGYGAELLNALRWLASVAAAGILNALSCREAIAFVTTTLDDDRPNWKYEELTEHGAAFLTDRYHRADHDPVYQQGLESRRGDVALSELGMVMRQRLAS